MPRPTKEELRATLKSLGEEAPQQWTKPDIQFRIEELRQMKGESVTSKSEKTTLEQRCSELRKAARRKQTLVAFCSEELGMQLIGNEVMARMEMKAMEILRAKCPAERQDVVGFGKHAGKTYMTIKENRPDYRRWVMDTWKECGTEGVDPRLARLAAWLLDQRATGRR